MINETNIIQTILDLRAKIAEGKLKLRQYNREIGALLAGFDEDLLGRFDDLEQFFDDGEIDQAEYEKRLTEIFAPVSGEPQEKTTYDVFLSYSHKDRDEYGMEYIQRIKEEIEKALDGIIDQPRVFLDAEALQLGDLWHSKIMESIGQCKAFVCLVSEQYLQSGYSTRERLWWNARQTHDGRLLDGPYPIYYVKMDGGLFSDRREVKELMATQTDDLPWFEIKKQLQEQFISERLASINSIVRKKVNAAKAAIDSFCSVRPPLCDNFVGRVTELRELFEMLKEGRGKYPVIQAAGGVGKTELSVAYAYGFADQYPQGRFLIRMEHIHSWDDAFSGMLDLEGNAKDGSNIKVSAELGINEDELKQEAQSLLVNFSH